VQATQAEQAQALDSQLATMRALRERMEQAGADAERRAAAEAARADTLRAALAMLEAARAKAEAQAREDAARAERQRREQAAGEARRREVALARPPGPGPEPRGTLVAPVAGSIVRAWGEPTDAGPATGLSFRPAPQARVVSPCGGRVRFSGPFRSFGALLIVDCGGGYAFVLAGLERLDVAVPASVLAGEPVGTMPAWDAASSAPRPALYVELRRDGKPVNPAPFLRGRE
jgi:septal ring factor EnvC (AmiA/AmiB activator)